MPRRLPVFSAILVISAGVAMAAVVGSSKAAGPSAPTVPFVPSTFCSPSTCGGGDGINCDNNYSSTYGGYYNYAGYYRSASPSPGGSISGTVKMNSDHLTVSGNHTAAWIGQSNSAGTLWIQAGVLNEGGGLRLYIEKWGPTTNISDYQAIDEGPASYGTSYAVTITKVAGTTTTWKATVGSAAPFQQNLGFSGATEEWTSESFDKNYSNCDGLDATFASVSPARTQMNGQVTTAPDFIENLTNTGWESVQLGP